MQLTEGTLLHGGTYKIEKMLGQGSFGITYLAEHTSLGKKFAIKEFFMKDINSRDEDGTITGLSDGSLSYYYAQKFRKEAMNLASMEHMNIVRVTDSFDENGTFYYVMDYIEGQNLNEYLKDHVLSESEAISIIKDVADALIYMHEEKHMLHLDLKPGNIMRRASDGHIFLIDFGLSKHYDVNGAPETSTNIGLGTPGYAPTEQGDKVKSGEFRPTIDVYALGATLFKLLTRETPPTASEVLNDNGVILEKLQDESISQSIIDLVVKAMTPGYKNRIQTIRLFNEMLPSDDEETFVGKINNLVLSLKRVYDGWRTSAELKIEQLGKWKVIGGVVVATIVVVTIIYGLNISGSSTNAISYDSSTDAISYPGGSYKMVYVANGTFCMGSRDDDAADDERILHYATLDDYYIGQTEVTQGLWKAVMGSNPSKFKGDDLPVECVSWNDCNRFISKLNGITGKEFRLPTEAEWEFAARGGNKSQSYRYSGSNDINEVAWYNCNSDSTSHQVATKQANELGIYDMTGNVWEWCSDWYGDYDSTHKNNPTGSESGNSRVRRGGSWYSGGSYRTTLRGNYPPFANTYHLGLRLVLVP